MAKIGLRYPVYKTDTSYGVIGRAIQADIAITVNDGKLYSDDALSETDKTFQSGAITLGVDDLSDTIQEDLLGHAVDDGEIIAGGSDIAPYVSIGFYAVKRVSGVSKYRAIWLKKVQFAEPADTNATKGETVVFNTPTIEGTIMVDDDDNWKNEKTFDTAAEAVAYLQGKSGVKEQCSKPVADVAAGTYSVAQEVGLTAGDGETIHYTTDGTTPSATNGTEFTADVDITATCALKAIAIKAGNSNSEIATYEYFID